MAKTETQATAKAGAAAPAKAPAKTKAATPRKATGGLTTPMQPSAELAAIVGAKPLARSEIVKAMWVYIKAHNLQDATDKRTINADKALAKVFGKPSATMFEMNKLITGHLSAVPGTA
ncbi:SWIB/MDM2 domain-containing protein (plasmid) [Polymorphobacter sp. PAMC 29334]|jgi:upstream activation factor subunit UAF30|uniref:SWIB/MDM2 domain-containing protein n=1 Tax=Polymorphobacter sp. PAMC 29334 TaxID=2862331 RepID=UPI001C742BE8|nr:SWIB/MDM2 domain-containing protein [Polymorphobacter sp. PAMC 29334]QYE37030.1 SWIB/MDM2 domain-containing protein [Polymorphobacter sp. PAMC 29334]